MEVTGIDGTCGFEVGRGEGALLGLIVLGPLVGRLVGLFDGSFDGCLVLGLLLTGCFVRGALVGFGTMKLAAVMILNMKDIVSIYKCAIGSDIIYNPQKYSPELEILYLLVHLSLSLTWKRICFEKEW